jgi:hypothetical protein
VQSFGSLGDVAADLDVAVDLRFHHAPDGRPRRPPRSANRRGQPPEQHCLLATTPARIFVGRHLFCGAPDS